MSSAAAMLPQLLTVATILLFLLPPYTILAATREVPRHTFTTHREILEKAEFRAFVDSFGGGGSGGGGLLFSEHFQTHLRGFMCGKKGEKCGQFVDEMIGGRSKHRKADYSRIAGSSLGGFGSEAEREEYAKQRDAGTAQTPIVVVEGMASRAPDALPLIWLWTKHGLVRGGRPVDPKLVFVLTHGASISNGIYWQDVELNRLLIEAVLDYTGSPQIDVVGFSKGGLIGGKAIVGGVMPEIRKETTTDRVTEHGILKRTASVNIGATIATRVRNFLMIATPINGARACTNPRDFISFFLPLTGGTLQNTWTSTLLCNPITGLSPDSEFLRKLKADLEIAIVKDGLKIHTIWVQPDRMIGNKWKNVEGEPFVHEIKGAASELMVTIPDTFLANKSKVQDSAAAAAAAAKQQGVSKQGLSSATPSFSKRRPTKRRREASRSASASEEEEIYGKDELLEDVDSHPTYSVAFAHEQVLTHPDAVRFHLRCLGWEENPADRVERPSTLVHTPPSHHHEGDAASQEKSWLVVAEWNAEKAQLATTFPRGVGRLFMLLRHIVGSRLKEGGRGGGGKNSNAPNASNDD